ncbi:MBL fold metallo-hydrolase [archaeon]|nr:MBL fold metallo-hydrolase [archaeon]
MEIQFLGAAREVGRSAILLQTKQSKLLLDYGLKLGGEDNRTALRPLPVHGYLDAVILSHAHLDHCGAIPHLFQSAEPSVYMNPATLPITEMLIRDSMHIARQRKQETYNNSTFKRMLRNVKPVPYNQFHSPTQDISFKFSDAGHILGSCMTQIKTNGMNVFYTGDYKNTDTHMHKGAKKPGESEVLIIEATYGAREHPDRKKLEKDFIESIRAVIEAGGSVVLPAFAVGRTQEIVTLLYSNKIHAPVYMDGMGRAISEIYLDYSKNVKDYDEFYGAMKWVNWITHHKQREQVFNEPSVVVTTAGMLSGGPVMEYLPELRTLRNSALFFTGFQVPGTPGRIMLEEKKMEFDDVNVNFSNIDIKYFDFSAHCDEHGVKKFISGCNPKLVLVQHGEEEQCEDVVDWVEQEIGCFAFAPKLREKFKVEDFV